MKKELRTIAVLILCGLLLYNSMGYMLVYSFNRMVLRDQIFSSLSTVPDQNLRNFTFPKNRQVSNFNNSKLLEIKVEGQMYDVVRYKDNGNSITYYCLRDIKEEQLIAKSILLNDHPNNTTTLPNTARLILDQMIKIAVLSEKMQEELYTIPCLLSTSYSHIYSVPVIPVPAPPPQTIC